MVFKKLFLLGLFLGMGQVEAMKRQAENDLYRPVTLKRVKISLMAALEAGDWNLFKWCVAKGADVNQKSPDGSPLFFVLLNDIDHLKGKNFEIALKAIAISCFNQDSNQALNVIRKNNNTIKFLYDCLALILNQKSFDVNNRDSDTSSPLQALAYRNKTLRMQAFEYQKIVSSGDKDFIELLKATNEHFIVLGLLVAGADVNECDNRHGNSILHWMIATAGKKLKSDKNALLMMDALICHGADVNKVNNNGYVPLHFCFNDITMTSLLLSHNVYVDNDVYDDTNNPYVHNMLENQESIDAFKKDFAYHVTKVTVQENAQCSSVQLLRNRQISQVRLQPVVNVHAKAIEAQFAALSEKNIISAMDPVAQMNWLRNR